jgi:hypothetical protein
LRHWPEGNDAGGRAFVVLPEGQLLVLRGQNRCTRILPDVSPNAKLPETPKLYQERLLFSRTILIAFQRYEIRRSAAFVKTECHVFLLHTFKK